MWLFVWCYLFACRLTVTTYIVVIESKTWIDIDFIKTDGLMIFSFEILAI